MAREPKKIDASALGANSVGLHFRDRVKKIKDNGKKTKIENRQNGEEKYHGKNLAYVHIWGKTSKIL